MQGKLHLTVRGRCDSPRQAQPHLRAGNSRNDPFHASSTAARCASTRVDTINQDPPYTDSRHPRQSCRADPGLLPLRQTNRVVYRRPFSSPVVWRRRNGAHGAQSTQRVLWPGDAPLPAHTDQQARMPAEDDVPLVVSGASIPG